MADIPSFATRIGHQGLQSPHGISRSVANRVLHPWHAFAALLFSRSHGPLLERTHSPPRGTGILPVVIPARSASKNPSIVIPARSASKNPSIVIPARSASKGLPLSLLALRAGIAAGSV